MGGSSLKTPREAQTNNVRVVARIRPFSESEKKRRLKVAIEAVQEAKQVTPPPSPSSSTLRRAAMNDITPVVKNTNQRKPTASSKADSFVSYSHHNNLPTTLIVNPKKKKKNQRQFDFDAVLPPNVSQQQVYQAAVGNIQHNIFRGYNATVIAYGQTGSGKTYTMSGPENSTEDDDGIIPRAVQELFRAQQEVRDVSIYMTYLEIYNDELFDLLSSDDQRALLKLRDQGDGVDIQGLTSVPVKSSQQVRDLMNQAILRRTTTSTEVNEQSSRSHTVCTLIVTVTKPTSTNSNSSDMIRAKLTLVDLAGSERIKKTGVVGKQQQESININKDLFVLGKVVSALSEKSKKTPGSRRNSFDSTHVPYRDSKLTRILRDSLGGKYIQSIR